MTAHVSPPRGVRALGLLPWKPCLSSAPLQSLVCGSLKTWLVCLLHPVSGAEVKSPVHLAPSMCPYTQTPLCGKQGWHFPQVIALTPQPGFGATSHIAPSNLAAPDTLLLRSSWVSSCCSPWALRTQSPLLPTHPRYLTLILLPPSLQCGAGCLHPLDCDLMVT